MKPHAKKDPLQRVSDARQCPEIGANPPKARNPARRKFLRTGLIGAATAAVATAVGPMISEARERLQALAPAPVDVPSFEFDEITIGELQAGIEMTREQDPAKAAEIELWLEQVARTFNILPMDAGAFRAWARLMHRRSDDLIEDAMIAATATMHNLTVVTRNTRDFDRLGVRTLNPFRTA